MRQSEGMQSQKVHPKVSALIILSIAVCVLVFSSHLADAACIDNPTDAMSLNAGTYSGRQMFSIGVHLDDTIKVKVPADGDDIYMILYGPLFEDRVCEIFAIESEQLFQGSRQQAVADARGLFCYWAVRELGYSATYIAGKLNRTVAGVVYAVRRGEKLAKDQGFKLLK